MRIREQGRARMQHEWRPDQHAPCWTLADEERALLTTKTGATRLAFALLLKVFQLAGRFPERRDDIAENVVAHVAAQVGVSPDTFAPAPWSERTAIIEPKSATTAGFGPSVPTTNWTSWPGRARASPRSIRRPSPCCAWR